MLRENDNVGSKGNCERINSIKRACKYNMLRIKKKEETRSEGEITRSSKKLQRERCFEKKIR